jgi:hypothetical protein
MTSSSPSLSLDTVVIRPGYPEDDRALSRLAMLDSRRPLTGPVLVAERDGRLLAAISADDGRAVADPFAPTAGLVALLRVRVDEATRAARPQAGAWRRAPGLRRRPAVAGG